MPDHPTPTLREAAEMVAADARDETVEDRAHCRISLEAIATLRAALAAEDAWRARAEAAVKYSDAEIAYREAPPGRDLAEGLAVNDAFDEYVAARRRYEETCRG